MRRWRRWAGLAVVLLVSVPLMWAYLSPREPNPPRQLRLEAEQPGHYPGGSGCRPERLPAPTSPNSEVERERCVEAAEEYRLKQNDLAQQTRSADAAEAMVRQSYLQTKALALATVLGFLTLIAAFLAAMFARSAALEAGKAVKDARSQTAAHIIFNSAEMRFTPSNNAAPDDAGSFLFQVQATNVGGTRAHVLDVDGTVIRGTDTWNLANRYGYGRVLMPEVGLSPSFEDTAFVVSTADVLAGRYEDTPTISR